MLKLVRALPQLQVIVSALIKGLSSIGYIAMLLFLIYYIYAIIGTHPAAGRTYPSSRRACASNPPPEFR